MRTRRDFRPGTADWSASRRWVGRNTPHEGDTVLRLTGAAGVTSVTPRFDFSRGAVEVYRNGVYVTSLTSGVEATGGNAIALAPNDTLEYRCTDWNAITLIAISNDKCAGDLSGWVLPDELQFLYLNTNSFTGDLSGWTLPDGLVNLYLYNNSFTYGTGGAFTGVTANLVKIDFDDCDLDENEVDRTLADLVSSGVTGKAFDVAGSNVAPTAAGEANKTTLVTGRGWTVSTTAP